MKNKLIAVLSLTIFATSMATAATSPDLSSPISALKSYLLLQRSGASLEEFKAVVSEENFAIVAGMSEAMGDRLDMSESMPPQDKYAKCRVSEKGSTADRAIFQVKVMYKDAWLAELEKELKAMGMGDIPTGQKTGGGEISDASPGEEDEYPFHINGEGYVSFLFVKQKGKWRFHKSFATNQPTDFKPLLKADDLSGGFAITKKQPSRTESAPKSVTKQENIDPTGGLSGKFNGKAWTGKYVYLSMFNDAADDYYSVEICAQEEESKFKRMSMEKLDIKLPKKAGVYKLGPQFNMTFFTPPGSNAIAMEGSMTAEKKGAAFVVNLSVRKDDDNELSGGFVFSPPE